MPDLLIETQGELIAHLGKSKSKTGTPICAIDTEADSLHRYRESLCLIQFAIAGDCVLIDPLAIKDLSSLSDFLSDATVWMHGADYDMTMLKRQFGQLPAKVYDTQIGARLLGARRFGLGDLVENYFGVELSKSSQKADWGKRPLSEKMIDYALNDVRYLLEMGEKIVADLKAKDRYSWFEESCAAAQAKVWERDENRDEAWRIQGSGKLPPLGLAYLRALWHWRDREAASWDKPSFMVVANRQLIEWCGILLDHREVVLPHHYRSDRVKRFKDAVEEVAALPKSELPQRPQNKRRKRDKDFDRKVDALLKTRERVATELDIEGSLIAPRAVLEAVAGGESDPADLLLVWQRKCLGL